MAASNFAKGMVIGLQVGAASAKPPVLTELTVTENGVYDEPVIVKYPVIRDPEHPDKIVIKAGDTLTFKRHITLPPSVQEQLNNSGIYEGIMAQDSDFCVSADGSAELDWWYLNYQGPEGYVSYLSQGYCNDTGYPEAGWYNENDEKVDPPTITVGDSFFGSYLYEKEEKYFFEGTSTPADGWNKVTVNVAGDIIDVPELPTENIEQNKVYRVAGEEYVEGCFVKYGDVYLDASDNEGPILAPILGQAPEYYTVEYILVDELPPKSEMKTSDTSVRGDLYVYIVRSTGKGYVYDLSLADGAAGEIGAVECWFNYSIGEDVIGGVVSDKSEIPEDDMWYTVIKKQPDFYGIPDEANNKTVFEHTSAGGWVEVGASEPCTHVPNMVPNDGSYVENVYFNTWLLGEDWEAPPAAVIAELEKIPKDCWINGAEWGTGAECAYLIYRASDEYTMGYVEKNVFSSESGADAAYAIRLCDKTVGCYFLDIFATGDADHPYIWYYSYFEHNFAIKIGQDTLTQMEGTSAIMKVGTANHLLTNLISIRPFDAN